MPLFLILSKHWGSSISGAFLLRVEKEASAPALRLRKGNKGSCNNFTEWIPSGLFSGKYVPAVRCNTDLLECIGDTLGNKMFGSRIMVRNKMKKRFLCTRGGAWKAKQGKSGFWRSYCRFRRRFVSVMLLFVWNRTNVSATLKVRLRNRLSGLDNFW